MRIPPGVSSGQSLSLRGKGWPRPKDKRGDQLVKPEGHMLRANDIARIAQVLRLRRDLGLNLVGAGMVLEMAQEIARLRAQLQAYQSYFR